MKTVLTILGMVFLLAPVNLLKAAESWRQVKQSNGIEVYVQAVKGSDIIRAKVRARIPAALKQVQAILDDVAHRSDWVPYLQTSRILHQQGPGDAVEYSHFAAPWPASDRDFVYHISKIHDDDMRVEYRMESVVGAQMPEQPGIVRAELIESRYSLIALDDRHTSVELIFHADPRGWLPAWIVNIIQKILPYRIVKNLQARAANPQFEPSGH